MRPRLPRWAGVVLAARGIWHRGVLSAMVLVVASAGAAAGAMGVSYGAAGDTAVLRDALRTAAPQDRGVLLTGAWWPESKTPAEVLRQRSAALFDATVVASRRPNRT